MSNQFENQHVPFPFPGMLSILVALLAVFVEQFEPLQSSRPNVSKDTMLLSKEVENIDARLWQDPFAAVKKYSSVSLNKKTSEQDKLMEKLACSIVKHKTKIVKKSESGNQTGTVNKSVIIIGAMVFGGPYAENAEFRLRTRYAVLSGLAMAGFVPEDAEHIGVVNNLKAADYIGVVNNLKAADYIEVVKNLKTADLLLEQMPFEWFINPNTDTDTDTDNESSLLLLWLNESRFFGKPLSNLQALQEIIKTSVAINTCKIDEAETELIFKFIGPASSTLLMDMVKERTSEDFDEETIPEPLDLYSASATASESIVLRHAGEGSNNGMDCSGTLAECFKRTNNNGDSDKDEAKAFVVSFNRVVGEDSELTAEILNELKRRGIDLLSEHANNLDQRCLPSFKDKSHLAMISEWDTFYGRALPETMIAFINSKITNKDNRCDAVKTNSSPDEKFASPDWVHLYSYMRGLDGIVPGMSNTNGNSTYGDKLGDQQKNGAEKSDAKYERPAGQSQQDYLRRLAERIEETNQELKRKGEGEIRAIGILGSDVYDKLLVLKALRPKFPRAIFFTTDLDARLFHPEEFNSTRNLVVTSSFGLKLHPALQGKIPPFRDSYNTAFFLATQIALHNALSKEKLDQIKIDSIRKTPRVFELGFQKAFGLNPGVQHCESLDNCVSVQPAGYTAWSSWKMTVALSLAICLGIMLLMMMNQKINRCLTTAFPFKFKKNKHKVLSFQCKKIFHASFSVFLCGVIISGIIIFWELDLGYQGEPFAWVEGVSIWPSTLIRLFTCISCWFFVFKVMRDLQECKKSLTQCYSLRQQRIKGNDLGLPWAMKLSSECCDVDELWRTYCYVTQLKFSRKRAFIIAVVYAVFAMSLVVAFGPPHVPYRGFASLVAHVLVLVLTIAGFILLVMLIFDATRHCVELLREFSTGRFKWPSRTLVRNYAAGGSEKKNNDSKLILDLGKYNNHLAEWLVIRFIALLTDRVGNFIYYPFLILALLIFALSPTFDNWYIPSGLWLVFIFTAAINLICALVLRRTAEKARQKAMARLNESLMAFRGREDKSARILENQLSATIEQIESIKQGAFLPLTNEPAIQALLLPLGGWGGFTLLEHLVLSGI